MGMYAGEEWTDMTDFESAMKKVADVLHAAARKSGEILENTKMSYNISMERDKITKIQNKIGEKFYKIFKDGGAVPEHIVDDLAAIAAIEETIRTMEKTIADSKPFKFCSDCGAKLELNDIYCAKCGAKQHDISPASDEEDSDDSDDSADSGECCDEHDKGECCSEDEKSED
ncbi:MAG: zinc-ribbon domain-containing protein [Oscillospiraceae bacterium]|nr:zinc-ribbon domain-containing protein [Oscillospiraceae bacterium]